MRIPVVLMAMLSVAVFGRAPQGPSGPWLDRPLPNESRPILFNNKPACQRTYLRGQERIVKLQLPYALAGETLYAAFPLTEVSPVFFWDLSKDAVGQRWLARYLRDDVEKCQTPVEPLSVEEMTEIRNQVQLAAERIRDSSPPTILAIPPGSRQLLAVVGKRSAHLPDGSICHLDTGQWLSIDFVNPGQALLRVSVAHAGVRTCPEKIEIRVSLDSIQESLNAFYESVADGMTILAKIPAAR